MSAEKLAIRRNSRKRGMNVSKNQELKNYVVNSIVHNAFDPNELLRLINLLPDQPQLNENQQKWINRLTINYSWYGGTAQHALHATLQEPEMPDLPQNEFAQVLEVFSKWVQEQEEE